MRIIVLFGLILNLFLGCARQGSTEAEHWKAFENGKQFRDPIMSLTSLYALMDFEHPSRQVFDSLLSTYESERMMPSLYEASKKHLSIFADTNAVIKQLARSSRAVNDIDNAIRYYEIAIQLNPEVTGMQYELAVMCFETGKEQYIPLMLEMLNRVVLKESNMISETYISATEEWVPLKSAALNILGYHYLRQGEFVKAEDFLRQAIGTFPDFKLAKNNYDLAKEQLKRTTLSK